MFDVSKTYTIGYSNTSINLPGLLELEEYARKQFPELADLKSKWATREQIMNWFKTSDDVQEVFYMVIDTQTYERAKKSFFSFLEVREQ
jgi:hypothetical protein